MKREQEIFEIIEQNPGATGATIYLDLAAKSWAARRFGEDSIWATIFAPSIGWIYVQLARLEQDNRVRSEWGWKVGDKPRRRHYYAIPPSERGSQ